MLSNSDVLAISTKGLPRVASIQPMMTGPCKVIKTLSGWKLPWHNRSSSGISPRTAKTVLFVSVDNASALWFCSPIVAAERVTQARCKRVCQRVARPTGGQTARASTASF